MSLENSLFVELTQEEKEKVLQHFVTLKFSRKDLVYAAEQWKRDLFISNHVHTESWIWMYFISSWIIKISVKYWNKKNTIAFLRWWDFFWEISTILNFKPTAEVTAISDSEIFFIEWKTFSRLLLSIPRLSYNLNKYLAKKIQHQSAIIFDHVFRSLESRIASNILNLVEEFWEDKWWWNFLISIKITHQELADFVWTNRETVTKIITKFRKKKIVTIDDRYMIVNSVEKLKEIMW